MIATGAQYRRLDVPRLDEFEMGGVYYAATQAEALLCAGDPVVIVGGGNSAGQAAMFLSRHASACRLLIRGDDLGKSMSRYLVDQVERNDLVTVCKNTEVVELDGDRELETITIADTRIGRALDASRQGALRLHRRPRRIPSGSTGQLATDVDGFVLTGRDVAGWTALAEHDGNRPAISSRPAAPGSSPSAMSVPDRSSASPLPSARGRWRSGWFTTGSPPSSLREERRNRCPRASHLDQIQVTAAPGVGRGLRGVPEDRRSLAAPADLPRVRQGRLLRRLAEQARHRPCAMRASIP